MLRYEVYIAFSIAGTNTFITARKEMSAEEALALTGAPEFFYKNSRRPGFAPAKELKMGWTKLNRADGSPMQNPIWVVRRFNELAKDDWTIDKTKFVQRFFSKGSI